MLERYFIKPSTLDRIQASWIASAIEQYVVWIAEHGYSADRSFPSPGLGHLRRVRSDRGANSFADCPSISKPSSPIG